LGTPKELYMNPKSIFVAHFIGESNFLEGSVNNSQNSGNSTIELRGGTQIQVDNNEFPESKQVVLSIRPESVIFEEGLQEGTNVVSGKVERLTFEGPLIRYEIKLDNDELVVAIKSSQIGEWLKIGDRAKLFFPAENIRVFPYPKGGLKEEVSVA